MAQIEKSVTEVRALCIKNNWFTNGDNTQYSKMFDRVAEHADVEEIATLIWICSENVDKEDIIKQLTPKRNNKERIEVIRAMEILARAVNDEDIFYQWLVNGIADGDITDSTSDDDLDYYADDTEFAGLMDTFLKMMSEARKEGGLYVDGIISKPYED